MSNTNLNIYDKISGMIMGHALGDALGAPHEFPPYGKFTGKFNKTIMRARTQKSSVLGQITDDAEMAMALIYSMKESKTFSKNEAIKEYIKWANNDFEKLGKAKVGLQPFLGRNTKHRFGEVKNIREFKEKFSDKSDQPTMQSNGALMRSYPLAVANLTNNEIKKEVWLTNQSNLSVNADIVYLKAISLALEGKNKEEIKQECRNLLEFDELKLAYNQAVNNEFRDVTGTSKGWVVHAFYCAFWSLFNFNNVEDGINAVICLGNRPDIKPLICMTNAEEEQYKRNTKAKDQIKVSAVGDTDTNAAISGALLGAYYGITNMCRSENTVYNMRILIRANPNLGDFSRPLRFHFNIINFFDLVNTCYMVYILSHNK